MKYLPLVFLLVTMLFSSKVFSCEEAQLLACLKNKGGVTCFFKHSCQQDKYKSQYCRTFDLDICLKYEGGKACLYNLDDCRYFLEQERRQKVIEQSSSSKSSRTTLTQANTTTKNSAQCMTEKVKNCLRFKGGSACFKKFGCDSNEAKVIVCSTFDFKSCLRNGGGKACRKSNSECQAIKNQPTQSNQTPPQMTAKNQSQNGSASQTPNRQQKNSPEASEGTSITSTDSNQKTNQLTPTTESKGETKSNDTSESAKCDSDKVIQCEKNGGKDDCYEKNHCTPLSFQKHFCENFDPNKCSQNRGGQTCKLIAKNCQIFLTKLVNDPSVQNDKLNQSLSNNQTSKEEPKVELEKQNIVINQNAPTLDQTPTPPNQQVNPSKPSDDKKITLDPPKTECQRQTNNGAPDTAEINSMTEQLKKISERDKILEDEMLSKLRSYGHRVFPIKNLSVIVKKGSSISSSDLVANKCSALLSGTFFGGGHNPVGPYMKDQQLTIPDSKTVNRGYVAIMNDGSVNISSMNNPDYNYRNASDRQMARTLFKDHLNKVEEQKGKKVEELLGGGALLIRPDSNGDGKAVSINDLESHQFFDQGIGNLTATQMRKTNHVVSFIHNGRPYAMMTASVSGNTLQQDLLEAKVQSAVKFDGGSGCAVYVSGKSGNICPSQGANPTGLCVK